VTLGDTVRSARTDAAGYYQVDQVSSGDALVVAVDPVGGLRGEAWGYVPDGESATIDVELAATGTIYGTVFGRDLVTPVGGGVWISVEGPTSFEDETDENGQFRFRLLPLGTYTVEVYDDDDNYGVRVGTLNAANQILPLDVRFLGRGTVAGVVFDENGEPFEDADVVMATHGLVEYDDWTWSDWDGEFEFEDVFAGTFEIWAFDRKRPVSPRRSACHPP
jgi:hypothetical protein